MKHRKISEQQEKDIQEIVDYYMTFVTGEHYSIKEGLEYFWKCMSDYTIEDYLETVRERKLQEPKPAKYSDAWWKEVEEFNKQLRAQKND